MAGALRPGGRFVAHVPDRDWEPVLKASASEWATAVRHGFSADELASRFRPAVWFWPGFCDLFAP